TGGTGANGATGGTGATGATGGTGVGLNSFISVFRSFSGTGTDTVAAFTPITFTNLSSNVGSAFLFTAPSDTITISQSGFYLFDFVIHNQGSAIFNLEIGGVPVTPTPFTGDGGGPIAGSIILNITTVPTTVQLVNANNSPAQLHNNTNTTLTILKLTP
ncbi:hypothetical protein EEL32_23760, partial [Brevibacillus laterosporus]